MYAMTCEQCYNTEEKNLHCRTIHAWSYQLNPSMIWSRIGQECRRYKIDERGGGCWYPTDWVPPHTSSKPRQEAGHATTSCHVSCGAGPHLPAREGSDATAYSWIRAQVPHSGGLWRCHTSHGSGPYRHTREGSGAATRLASPDPASLLERAPMLLCVPRHWTLPPYSRGLWHHHVSHRYP
jgi:hypothetical protein